MHPWSPSGLQAVPHLRWGSHLAHFFNSGEELRDLLVPYFKAGLENNERCLWVTGQAFDAEEARQALRTAVSDLDRRESRGQIEIVNGAEWYSTDEKLRPEALIEGLLHRNRDAEAAGHTGLRTSGNCAWVGPAQWPDFLAYEALVQKTGAGRRMICLCSYCIDTLASGAEHDVMERHHFALPARNRPTGSRTTTESAQARQKRTFDLAMAASNMGTWRYTLADNVCLYDENAQRLYGLSDSRFLHDEAGVRAKFHPDDVPGMWAKVQRALHPEGDGRYDVEYRVRQPDGSWRWLSAWGLVEFEGSNGDRRPLAIMGASRDLTAQKRTQEVQRLLLNEASHRVKNTLANVQAITALTLRDAHDLERAREALEQRIQAMARAHDLLSARSWIGAALIDLVDRSLEPFAIAQIDRSGPAIDVSPRHALGLSLAFHELATNASKYGALSRRGGRVRLSWQERAGRLHLDWLESGGPTVAAPKRKGFGSRLLEDVVRDLGGEASLDYAPSGLSCRLDVRL